jgi:hypothetical protein
VRWLANELFDAIHVITGATGIAYTAHTITGRVSVLVNLGIAKGCQW